MPKQTQSIKFYKQLYKLLSVQSNRCQNLQADDFIKIINWTEKDSQIRRRLNFNLIQSKRKKIYINFYLYKVVWSVNSENDLVVEKSYLFFP